MIHLKELDKFNEQFGQCNYEPLRITFNLKPNSQIVNYDPIHLDGLLARAVVEIATEGRLLADREDGYWIPLPLKMLWQDEEGYPLWAASVLYPVSDAVDDIYVRHKRNSDGWLHDKKKLNTRNGPWMERRIPTPIQVCNRYEARCIGNKEMVEKLLGYFTHIGKLRLGRVNNISVESCEYSDGDTYLDSRELIRPIPAESELLKFWPDEPSLVGWTPPFWKPTLFRKGWRAGTVADELFNPDFFASVSKI